MSGRSKDSQDKKKAEWSEFIADYTVNNMIFSYHAEHIDHDDKVLNEAGMDLDANGAIIYAQNNAKQIGSKFQLQADEISLVVTTTGSFGDYSHKVNTAEITAQINNDGRSSVKINADKTYITGRSEFLSTALATTLYCVNLSASVNVATYELDTTYLKLSSNVNYATWQSKTVVDYTTYALDSNGNLTGGDHYAYLYYLGHL